MKLSRKRLMEIAGLSESLTADQQKGLFVIGDDVAKERFQHDEDYLVEVMIEMGLYEDQDFTLVKRPVGFPDAVQILPRALSKVLADQEQLEFLQDLEQF